MEQEIKELVLTLRYEYGYRLAAAWAVAMRMYGEGACRKAGMPF